MWTGRWMRSAEVGEIESQEHGTLHFPANSRENGTAMTIVMQYMHA